VFAEQEVGAPAATGWSPYALDDFNGDGRAELVWHAGWVEDGPEERFQVCDGYAHETWQQQVEVTRRYRPDERAYYLFTTPGYLGDLDADATWSWGYRSRPMPSPRGSSPPGSSSTGRRRIPAPRCGSPPPSTCAPASWTSNRGSSPRCTT
ncbi:MAG: hypothetical protein WDA75_23180, partial [Candidatus Latescibacterota bacterium]